ncbi:FAD-binding oxidoreductase [Candidatus Saccharibacteria bacterium]|nr:FAD-binding oxidoreductase [Candidatus Saccharibacteria bacterium]
MKKPYLKELQSQLTGMVTDAADAREYFSTDGSIFKIVPEGVIYPKNTSDVQLTVAYLAERAKAGKRIGLIPRGQGTDQGGGAIGDGLQLVFPAHMNKLLRLDKDTVTVQPGMSYASLQQTLHTHGRFLPPYPASLAYASIGGSVANDAAGEKTVKYGSTHKFVKRLKVVLSDGSTITTERISARQLARKKGLNTFEGQLYRGVDRLVDEHVAELRAARPKTTKNTAGYALDRVKNKDGSFDLSQLIVGSQGTLGVVTEITLATAPWNPRTTLVVGYFDDLAKAGEATQKLKALNPSALELVDYHLLEYLRQNRPHDIEGLVPEPLPKLILLVEFDNTSQLQQTLAARRAQRLFRRLATGSSLATDLAEQDRLWKIRREAAAVIWMAGGDKKALPFIEDGIVPPDKLPQFLEKIYKLLRKHDIEIAVWGHAGDANLHMQPFLNLAKKKDVDKLFVLAREFNDLVTSLGGSTSAEHNDGLIRSPYIKELYGEAVYKLFVQTKALFDPQNILNPGKKIDVSEAQIRQYVRSEYNLKHLYDHMPSN